ncbi:conserved hypothetical protein [Sporisorium reilianum SRZ2]|uniref:Uncharacterized protein n=1 Tax=Sporisorium reilianum (strain SRZ2) TaxID=999809 RepID=E6ZPW0_SPORE|nr:conserved hypothetical protein [Sporisorium reilianum SRZ2]
MFQSAPSPGRTGAHSAAYGFATPVRTPFTSYHSQQPYSQALTPADASASKAVRFQNQPLAPQQQHQHQAAPQTSALASSATPNRSPYYNAVSAQTQSPQQRNTVASAPANASKMPTTRASVSSTPASGTESKIALTRRIKWNLGALALLWIVPALTTKPRDAYWLVLDQIYLHVGGDTDELVDGVVGWILWAISVVLFFNAVEAAVLVRRASDAAPPAPAAVAGKAGTVLGMHSPHVAKSINFVAASRLKGSPKTRTSNIGAGSPISRGSPGQQDRASPTQASPGTPTAVDYAQFSPSLRRTSNTVPSPSTYTNSGGFGNASRMGTPSSPAAAAGGGASSSPLAAFRARHAPRASSGSPSSMRARSVTPSASGAQADLSLEEVEDGGEATFLGDESFEVDRALKSLRHSLGGVASTPAPVFR